MSIEVVCDPDDRAIEETRQFFANSSAATPQGDPIWCRILFETYRQPTVIFRSRSADGALRGVLAGYRSRSLWRGRASFFGLRAGLVFTSIDAGRELAEAAAQYCRDQRCGSCLLSIGSEEPRLGFRVGMRTAIGLAVAENDAKQMEGLPGKSRNAIRKGRKVGVTVRAGHAFLDLAYDLYRDRMVEKCVPIYERRFFHAVARAFGANCEVLVAEHEGTPVSTMIVLYDRRTAYYWINGTTDAARPLSANHVLFADILERCRQRGLVLFDMAESTPGGSVHFFKTKFGGKGRPAYYVDPLQDQPPADNFSRVGGVPAADPRRRSAASYLPVFLRRPLLLVKRRYGRVV